MASRSNAASELTRFWLEERHGYLVREAVPVPVVINSGDLLIGELLTLLAGLCHLNLSLPPMAQSASTATSEGLP